MSNYALYDKLKEIVQKNNESKVSFDISAICETINSLSSQISEKETEEHYEEIGAIILHHEMLIKKSSLSVPAYSAAGTLISGGKGILYTIDKLPTELVKIIGAYIQYYSQ